MVVASLICPIPTKNHKGAKMAIPGASKYRVYCMTEMIDGEQFSDHFDFDSKSDFMEIFDIEKAGNAGMDYDIIRYLGYYDDEGNSFTVKDERL